MLEAVLNLSEGRANAVLASLVAAASRGLLDRHTDPWHNRSVLTLAGPDVLERTKDVARSAVELVDLTGHIGAHPRLGVLDVVPFVPIGPQDDLGEATATRDAFARWAGDELGLPCFLYGPERSLPEVRRDAWKELPPDTGPNRPHPTAGSCCVGAWPILVAYNLWLANGELGLARQIARAVRSSEVRALGFELDGKVQVSCNLLQPSVIGPAEIFDRVLDASPIERAELVGLLPASVLARIPADRWNELDLAEERTIEFRLGQMKT